MQIIKIFIQGDWLNKLWLTHIMDYCAPVQKNEENLYIYSNMEDDRYTVRLKAR